MSTLAWLGVLVVYLGHGEQTTLILDVFVLLLAAAALLYAVLAISGDRRSPLSWIALAVSLLFPVWLWAVVSNLPGDAF